MTESTDLQCLTLKEASKVLGVFPRTLWSLIDQGRIPHLRLGVGRGKIVIPAAVLHKWINENLKVEVVK